MRKENRIFLFYPDKNHLSLQQKSYISNYETPTYPIGSLCPVNNSRYFPSL